MSHPIHVPACPAGSLASRLKGLGFKLTKVWFSLDRTAVENSSDAAILARDQYCCVYCHRPLTKSGDTTATIDHVIPKCRFVSRAVANQDANRVACCLRCNRIKGNWVPSTRSSRPWYDRVHCLERITALLRNRY